MSCNPLISIIIPAYNAESFIRDCISSVINQTYKNLEIIIIDDGSNDKTAEICEEFGKKDNRIKLIKKNNGGVSSARNLGLDYVTGDYVGFVDADDRIAPEMYKALLGAILESGLQISQCRVKQVLPFEMVSAAEMSTNYLLINYIDALKSVWNNGYMWNKLFDASFFKGESIRFDEQIEYAEDEPVVLECLLKSGRGIVEVSNEYYYYTIVETSLTHAPFNLKRLNSLTGFKYMCDLIRENEKGLIDFFDSRYYSICVSFLKNGLVLKSKNNKEKVTSELKNNIQEILSLKNMTIKFKLAALIFSLIW